MSDDIIDENAETFKSESEENVFLENNKEANILAVKTFIADNTAGDEISDNIKMKESKVRESNTESKTSTTKSNCIVSAVNIKSIINSIIGFVNEDFKNTKVDVNPENVDENKSSENTKIDVNPENINENHASKSSENKPPVVKNTLLEESPVGKAIYDFGRSLKNTAIWLLVIDIITALIMDSANGDIVFDGRFSYNRFGGDFYTEVSKGLSEISAYLDSIFKAQVILSRFSHFMTGIVINATILAITIGRGAMNIGTAIAIERNQKIMKENNKE